MFLTPVKISCLIKTSINTNLASAPPNVTWSLSFRFHYHNLTFGFHLPHLFYTPRQSQISLFDFNNNICRGVKNYAALTHKVSMCYYVLWYLTAVRSEISENYVVWLQENMFTFVQEQRPVEDFFYWLQCGGCGVFSNRYIILNKTEHSFVCVQVCWLFLSTTRKETAHRALANQKKLAYLGFQLCSSGLQMGPDRLFLCSNNYRGADKFLARPGRKRLTGHLQPRRNWPTWASNCARLVYRWVQDGRKTWAGVYGQSLDGRLSFSLGRYTQTHIKLSLVFSNSRSGGDVEVQLPS
jgi:hypothetical protein